MAEQFTRYCSLRFTSRDDEHLELDFPNEEAALSVYEYLKKNPPLNLESLDLVKNLYLIDTWDNPQDDSWDARMKKLDEKPVQ